MKVIQLSTLTFTSKPVQRLRDFPLFYEASGETEDRKFWARIARKGKQ